MEDQFIWQAPFGMLGISCSGNALTGIEFLGEVVRAVPASTPQGREICRQLGHYFTNPDFCFDLPLEFSGTPHQHRVWRMMRDIPRGESRSYGEIAALLHSSPLAVGQACGANPLPVVIPCHRIVGKAGLGGFAHRRDGRMLEIKRWLLAHEGVI